MATDTVGGNLVSGLIGSAASAMFGKRQAQKQMDFQKMMSDTAAQRSVKDLRAAGLNPMLAATGALTASTPGGAMTSVHPTTTGKQVALMNAQIKNIQAMTDQAKAETDVKKGGQITKIFGTEPAKAIEKITNDVGSSAKSLMNTLAPLDPVKMRVNKPKKMKNVDTDIGDVSP
jgi:hypothetical protein